MPKSIETTPRIKGQSGSKAKLAQFALEAAFRVRRMYICLYALIPEDELVSLTAEWYRVYAEATLRHNHDLVRQWICTESVKASEVGIGLEDFLALLDCCRQCVIDVEQWDEDAVLPVDRVINETLLSLRGIVAWSIPPEINYVMSDVGTSAPLVMDTQILEKDVLPREKRNASRCQLKLPIRVRANDLREPCEETKTTSISRTGLSFVTSRSYDLGAELLVVYPYWNAEDQFNEEYLARVVRKRPLPDGRLSISIRFVQPLRHKSNIPPR